MSNKLFIDISIKESVHSRVGLYYLKFALKNLGLLQNKTLYSSSGALKEEALVI